MTQTASFSSIRVLLLSAEPIEVGDEWGPTFDEVVSGKEVESPAEAADETPSDKGITQE